MKESVIQNQIRLVAFKATRVNYVCLPKEVDKISPIPEKPIFNLKLDNIVFSDNPNGFAKLFIINITIDHGLEVISFEVEFQTFFECQKSVDQEFLNSDFAKISAAAIGFPYVRAFMSNISVQAGIPAVILPSINFIQWQKQQDEESAKSNNI